MLIRSNPSEVFLTLIWVGFLGVRFEVGGGGDYPLSKTC